MPLKPARPRRHAPQSTLRRGHPSSRGKRSLALASEWSYQQRAGHHDGEGPLLQQKMFDVMLTWLVLVPVAYAVGVGAAKARDMWRSR
jgi:hypothetical protein